MTFEYNSYFNKNEITQEGAHTSFALYDIYRTSMADDQQLTSEIRSRIDYLIPSDNIIVLFYHLSWRKKSNLIGRLLYDLI